MKILVTGGTGFIGSAIVNKLIELKNSVTVFANDVLPANINKCAKYITGDVFDSATLSRALDGHEAVIHAIGFPGLKVSNTSPYASFSLNVISVHTVLESMRRKGVSRFIFISSSSVHGKTTSLPIREDTPANPLSIYGFNKFIAEKLAESYSQCYGFEVTIARPFNVFGADENNILKLLVCQAQASKVADIYGEEQIRDFIHVDDVAHAISGLVNLKNKYEVYNIGTGIGRRINDAINLVREAYPNMKINYTPTKVVLYDSLADISKIQRAIAFNPDRTDIKMREVIQQLRVKCGYAAT
jgi:UDP-glucose 4-epimerase